MEQDNNEIEWYVSFFILFFFGYLFDENGLCSNQDLEIIENYYGILFLLFIFRSIANQTLLNLMLLDIRIDNENIDLTRIRNHQQFMARFSTLIKQYCRVNSQEWNDT